MWYCVHVKVIPVRTCELTNVMMAHVQALAARKLVSSGENRSRHSADDRFMMAERSQRRTPSARKAGRPSVPRHAQVISCARHAK